MRLSSSFKPASPAPLAARNHLTITIDTSSCAKRLLFLIVVLASTLPLIYHSYRIFLADRIVMTEKTFKSYTRSLEYDPSNATLWWQRGRLSHYSVENVDILQAISDYKKALSLNPRIDQAWMDLSDCYERLGQYVEAEEALGKACAARTYSSAIRWQAGNYYLRRGNLPKMYESFKMANHYDIEKLGLAMDLSWKVDPDRAQILDKLIPDTLYSNLRYLDFLVGRDELDLARAAWERSLQNDIPPNFEFAVSASFGYIDHLLARVRVPEALQVWDEALHKAGTSLQDSRRPGTPEKEGWPANLVWNGSFENEMLRGGFDWRYAEERDVQFQIVLNHPIEGQKCLQLAFAGSNTSSALLRQIVPVPEPGLYNLEFYFRTEELTADETPYFAIQGYPEAAGATLRTPLAPLSTPWRKVTVPFAVKPNCRAVLMTLARDPSSKLDNRLKGSFWLDGVAIYRSPDAHADSWDHRTTKVAQAKWHL